MNVTRLVALPSLLLLLAACGGATPEPVAPPTAPAAAGSAAPEAPAAAATSAPAPAAAGRDPKVAALLQPVLSCKFEDAAFDTDCPAYKAWDDEEALFEEGKADDTLFSMLGDADLKVRLLGASKTISDGFWANKDHARALAALGNVEKNDSIGDALGRYAGEVDWQGLGFAAPLKDLVQHAPPPFRRAIAFHLSTSHQSPAVVEAYQILIDDPERRVADTAVEALARGNTTEPLCKMMSKMMVQDDFRHSTAIWVGSSSKCAGMKEQVVVELGKRLADPGKVTKETGWDYVRAARHLCLADAPEIKKRGLEFSRKLADPKVPDAHTRKLSVEHVIECDPQGGPAFARTFLSDKEIGADVKAMLAAPKKPAKKKK